MNILDDKNLENFPRNEKGDRINAEKGESTERNIYIARASGTDNETRVLDQSYNDNNENTDIIMSDIDQDALNYMQSKLVAEAEGVRNVNSS